MFQNRLEIWSQDFENCRIAISLCLKKQEDDHEQQSQ